jgi:hypothetical protein
MPGSVHLPITAKTAVDTALKRLLPSRKALNNRKVVVVGVEADRRLEEIAASVAKHYGTQVTVERL